MIEAISKERWREAQTAEIQTAVYDRENCYRATQNIFLYLGVNNDQRGKIIVEVGCGPFPAVLFCENVHAVTFEPLWSKPEYCGGNTSWNQCAFEDFEFSLVVDEAWIFNCLQHVRDPELVVAKAKKCAPMVRFFEPVDYPTCIYHPHTFTEDDFRRWFGDSVKRYTDRLAGFFDSDCIYGTWRRDA